MLSYSLRLAGRALSALALASSFLLAPARAQSISRVDPTNWWIGMKNPAVQLLVYGPQIGTTTVTLDSYADVTLAGTEKLVNPNYLLLNLRIGSGAKPGSLKFKFKGKKIVAYSYELKARSTEPGRVQGVTSADFVYLLMPDRFANGDPTNDVVKGTRAPRIARDSLFSRHGGDLKGISDHFGYLKELGVTAIWPTVGSPGTELEFAL